MSLEIVMTNCKEALYLYNCISILKISALSVFCLFVTELSTTGSAAVITNVCSAFLTCLSENRELLPDVELLLEVAERFHPANRKPVHLFLLLLLLVSSACNQPTPALSLQILDMAVSYVDRYQVCMDRLLFMLSPASLPYL
jgi:hypothetical protein